MTKYNSININNYEEDEDDNLLNQTERAKLDPINNADSSNLHPQDHLVPPFSSNDRPSTLLSGTFNLVATIIGGGVLSLPIAFSKCGVFFTTLAMMLSAYMTYMSLIMLSYCSRRGGGSSYGEVVRSAFGEKAQEGMSWLLFVFLAFVIVAFMVLIRDIWTPLVASFVNHCYLHNLDHNEAMAAMQVNGDYVLIGIIVILLPFLCQRSLHALRWNCYIGFVSILVLCIALVRGGWQRLHAAIIDDDDDDDGISDNDLSIEWFKIPTTQEILFAFPILTCSFLCHFNIIAIQNAITVPTRDRMDSLIKYAITACFFLMYMFGLGGYLYAGDMIQGNVLLNVPMGRPSGGSSEQGEGEDQGEYWLFLLGRIGCGSSLMLAMPLIALPCREALLEVIDVFFHRSHHRQNAPVVINGNKRDAPAMDNEQFCWRWCHKFNKYETIQDVIITTEDEVTEILPSTESEEENGEEQSRTRANSIIVREEPIQKDYIFRNTCAHYGSTLLIVAMCYSGAVIIRGVAIVWSFIGSSMAFLIAFILPCGCFIVIEREVPTIADGGDRNIGWIRMAWAILVFSVAGAVICTLNSLAQI